MSLSIAGSKSECIQAKSIAQLFYDPQVDTSTLKSADELKKTKPVNIDNALVWRTLNGESAAFDKLVMKYQTTITSLVSNYVKDFDMVKDVVQETFIRAYNALGKYRFESMFYTWLYRIALNTAYSYLNSQKSWLTKVVPISDEGLYEYVAPVTLEPEKSSQNDDLKDAIQKSINKLPIKLRTALLLREYEGLGYEDISKVLNCELGTVKSRIARAREKVMKDLEFLYDRSN